MFSAWDFSSWFFSIGAVLFMLTFLTGFSALASALMSRVWGDGCEGVVIARTRRTAKEPSVRKLA